MAERDLMEMAYQVAEAKGFNNNKKKAASMHWQRFHEMLPTSLTSTSRGNICWYRAKGFNTENVNELYDKVQTLTDMHGFNATRLYGRSGITTVQKHDKVLQSTLSVVHNMSINLRFVIYTICFIMSRPCNNSIQSSEQFNSLPI